MALKMSEAEPRLHTGMSMNRVTTFPCSTTRASTTSFLSVFRSVVSSTINPNFWTRKICVSRSSSTGPITSVDRTGSTFMFPMQLMSQIHKKHDHAYLSPFLCRFHVSFYVIIVLGYSILLYVISMCKNLTFNHCAGLCASASILCRDLAVRE